jgi:hypothetical protein
LPSSWQPVKPYANDAAKDTQNYYFEVLRTEESYNINVYRVKVPVKFNDKSDLLEKNGPINESDYAGTISGEKITSTTPALSITIPSDAEKFELIPSVTAYKKDEGTAIWWSHKKWNFEFSGSSLQNNLLAELATAWDEANIQAAQTGKVTIIGGNKLTFNFMWDKQDSRYSYKTINTNFQENIEVINSFNQAEKLSSRR